MPLHIEYRPKTLEEFAGNLDLKATLASIIARTERPHAYLFVGPSGTGKTTLARILAKAFGCDDMDLYEYNSANLRGIDSVREIIERSRLAPKGPCKFYIMDEIHQQTSAAQEAMLKMLEDVPKNRYYALATTNPEKLSDTIKTRVTTFTTTILTNAEMTNLLVSIATKLPITIHADVIASIVLAVKGCAREGVKILDQVMGVKDAQQQLNMVKSIIVGEADIIQLCRRIFQQDSGFKKWTEVRDLLSKIKDADAERIRVAVYRYLGKILMNVKSGQGMLWIVLLQAEFKNPIFHVGRAELENQFCQACLVQFPKEGM